jgi:DNA-binding NtrC family response regulator
MLSPAGMAVKQSKTLAEGLAIMERQAFDMVILDLNTGDSFGLDTLETFRDRHPEVPIVVLTGKHPKAGLDAIHLGAQDFLIKTHLTAKQLINVVRFKAERSAHDREARQAVVNKACHSIATPLTPFILHLELVQRKLADQPEPPNSWRPLNARSIDSKWN